MSTERRLVLGCLTVALWTGCSGTPSPDWEARLRPCPTDAEIGQLVVGDRLEIRVHEQAELSGEYEVSPKGTLNFPLLGEVAVAGLRCDEVERALTDGLGAALLRDPYVVCLNKNVERTAVTVDGQVREPGVIAYRRGLMLTDVVAQSGGLTVRAKPNAVTITRKIVAGGTFAVVVPYGDIVTAAAGNVCMHPGDLVYVPESPL